MQRLGLVVHLSPSRNMVLKVEHMPRIGETVVDENLKAVGRVFDLMGPVSSPYALVRPAVQEPERLTSKTLYLVPSKGERRKR